MDSMYRNLAKLVILLGIIGVIMGLVFIQQGFSKKSYMVDAMKLEKVTLGDVHAPGGNEDQVIDNAAAAQLAGDTIREHRRNIAPTYKDLMAGGRYDPANPKHLSYAQALNMENYLYLAVAGFGLVNVVLASGLFMIISGLAFMAIGLIFWKGIKTPVTA